MRTRGIALWWWPLMLGALLLVVVSSRYFTLDPESYFPRQRATYEAHTLALITHIGAMSVAALAGPTQFLGRLRARRPLVHRALGRTYVATALVGGAAGLYLAQYSASGIASDIGFALLALGVLGTTAVATRHIRARRVQRHREWMTRSYALIFAAVTLRLYLPFLEVAFGEQAGYALVAWLSWVPNLAFAEYLVRGRIRRATVSSAPLPATP